MNQIGYTKLRLKKKKENRFPVSSGKTSLRLLGSPFIWQQQLNMVQTILGRKIKVDKEDFEKKLQMKQFEHYRVAYTLVVMEMGKQLQEALEYFEETHTLKLKDVNKFYRITAHPGYQIGMSVELPRDEKIVNEDKYFAIHTSLKDGLFLLSNYMQNLMASKQLEFIGKLMREP